MKRPEDTEMNKSDLLRTLKSFFLEKLPKALLFYILAPLLCVVFLSKPIGEAACRSEAAAFLILLAALAAVILNWLVYTVRRRKRPSTLVFSYGVLCLLITAYMEHEAVPADSALSATLAIICGSLMMIFFLVLSHWFASRRQSKAALAIAVGLRIAFGVVLFFMACQVFRDFETRCVSRETWITVAILIACWRPQRRGCLPSSAVPSCAAGPPPRRKEPLPGSSGKPTWTWTMIPSPCSIARFSIPSAITPMKRRPA